MKNVQLEVMSISNVDELPAVFEKALTECKNIQIYISDALFIRLLKSSKRNFIWGESVLDSFHYCDTVEKAFLLNVFTNNEKNTVQMHFAGNCLGYMQLTYFAKKGLLYRHYLKGMKKILIINAD